MNHGLSSVHRYQVNLAEYIVPLTSELPWTYSLQNTVHGTIMVTQRCLVTLCFEWKDWKVHRIKWISYKWPYCSERWQVTCARISRIQVTKYTILFMLQKIPQIRSNCRTKWTEILWIPTKRVSFATVQILAQKGPSGELGAPHIFNPFFLVNYEVF